MAVVKRKFWYYVRPGFGSQDAHGGPQPSLTVFSGNTVPFDPWATFEPEPPMVQIHRFTENTYTEFNKWIQNIKTTLFYLGNI